MTAAGTSTGSLDVVQELCLLHPPAADATDLLTTMARLAVERGYAAPTFPAALVAREQSFPTGLPTRVPVAIPHADPEHVLRPGMALALVDGLPFRQMGAPDVVLDVRLVVLLLVPDAADHVDVLSHVVGRLQDEEWLQRAVGARTVADLVSAVRLGG